MDEELESNIWFFPFLNYLKKFIKIQMNLNHHWYFYPALKFLIKLLC